MKRIFFLLPVFLFCFSALSVGAKEYKVSDIPLVHLQDRMRYVSNPDAVLSSESVVRMDSMLYALEEQTGIQTLVVAVTGIEGGDCFEFAHQLGKQNGVGQKGRDNGLVILLSTDERCIQFATGYGLEGVLPDALCKRIQNRYMLPYFKEGNWSEGMLEGVRAVAGVLDGSMENEDDDEEEIAWALFIVLVIIVGGVVLLVLVLNAVNRCPNCKKRHALQRVSSHIVSRRKGIVTEEVTYVCRYCGHTVVRKQQTEDDDYHHPHRGGGGIFMGGGGFGSGGGGFSGGSFGGGSFGGGGAGSRF